MKNARKALAILITLGALAPDGRTAWAQDSQKIKELERKLEALSEDVQRMKLGEAAGEPAELKSVLGYGPAASKVYQKAPQRVSVGGYGEMTYQDFADRQQDGNVPANKRDEADFLRAVLYVGYKFNDWISLNSEIEFEHATDGKRGEVSVEMAQLDLRPWKALGFRAGLLLMPMGLINEIHEPTTFHGVRRPNVDSNIIPTTWRENGLGVFGEAGLLSYRSYLVAGLQAVSNTSVSGFSAASALRNGRSSGSKSFAEDKAWVSRVDVEPVPGILAGGSLYIGEADHTLTAASIPVTLWELHAKAERRGVELRALYAQGKIGNADALNAAQGVAAGSNGSIGSEFFGGYAEAAFDVLSLCPNAKHYLAPFFRYERYDTQLTVPDGWTKSRANSRVEYTAGLTYKPIPQVALKGDYQWMRNQARTGINQLNLGIGYIF